MEAKGHSQRWKTHLPKFKHRQRFTDPTAKEGERGETERDRDRGGQTHKSVMMAPKSSYLTDRQYVKRKPLFSSEQCTSILKKTHPPEHTQQEKQLDVSRREEAQQHPYVSFLSPESFSPSHSDVSSPSFPGEDLSSPMAASELRASLCHEEASSSVRRSAQRGLLSSILDVQRLNPPVRPRLTSTVLYPTYTPRSGSSRTGRTLLRHEGRLGEGGEENRLCSGGHSKVSRMSPHQANYWACAIPKAPPPSPDRHSSSWDPNREYQALLDYTYPLRPGQVVTEWDYSKLEGDSLLPTESNLRDSGIGLDHRCSSTSLSGLGFMSGTEQSRARSSLSGGHRSPDLQAFTKSSEGLPSRTLLTQTESVGLSLDSLDRGGMNRPHHQHHSLSSSSSLSLAFIRSTCVLPRSRCVGGEVEEEFLPLPEQLEELQLLSRQVRELTARLSRPLTASWESLGPGTTSILSSITLPETREDENREETEAKELEGSCDDTDQTGREEMSAAQTAAIHRDSKAMRRSSGAWMEPVGGGVNPSSLREVEALAEQLCGFTLPGSQRSSQENQEQSGSLMQHIQVFSSHLEQLIQQLHTVVEKMELLAVPSVDIASVKSSLAEYQSFQREVSSHQPLTSSVLHTGQLLLSCINTMSPFLRDTLLLIERQSGSLETHTEHLFSSILSAMDSLTRLKPLQQSRGEVPGPAEVQASTL